MSEIPHPTLEVTQQCEHCEEWSIERGLLHPPRYVELMHMSPDKLQIEIGRKHVIVLKCQKCGQMCKK